MPDAGKNPYAYLSQKTGKKNPTVALFSNDTESGKNSTKFQKISYTGVGFKVVATNNQMPIPPTSDYTPRHGDGRRLPVDRHLHLRAEDHGEEGQERDDAGERAEGCDAPDVAVQGQVTSGTLTAGGIVR
jgi:hypothetical protein